MSKIIDWDGKMCLDKILVINRFLNKSFLRVNIFYEGSMLIKYGLLKGFGRKLFFCFFCLVF